MDRLELLVNTPPLRTICREIRDEVKRACREDIRDRYMAIFVFFFGLLFCFLAFPHSMINEIKFLTGSKLAGEAKVTEVTEAEYSDDSYLRISYIFTNSQGAETRGQSYIERESAVKFSKDSIYHVTYLKDYPYISCLDGTSISSGEIDGRAAVLIFPLLGLFLILRPWIEERKNLYYLKKGITVKGIVESVEVTRVATNIGNSRGRYYKVRLSYLFGGEQKRATIKIAGRKFRIVKNIYSEKSEVTMLHHPRKCNKFILTDWLRDQ